MKKGSLLKGTENVLVLQGGGPSGAFGCGVLKAFIRRKIRIDIIAATSNGAINAAIYAGSKDEKHPERSLENFWLDIAKNSSSALGLFKQKLTQERRNFANIYLEKIRSSPPKANLRAKDVSHWTMEYGPRDAGFFPQLRNLIQYDNKPMLKVAEKYINYDRLRPSTNQNLRILLTAVDVLSSERLIFDNYKSQITPLHLLAASGYQQPVSNVEISEGTYAWDGSLLSTTPLREVMEASPKKNKKIFAVQNNPRKIEKLPVSVSEVMSRSKNIVISDKTYDVIKRSRLITRHIILGELLFDIYKKSDLSNIDPDKINYINSEYSSLIEQFGAKIVSFKLIGGTGESKASKSYADPVNIIKEEIKMGESKTLRLIDDGEIKS